MFVIWEGFVAPIPTDLPRNYPSYSVTTYFVTRRGKKIETPLQAFEMDISEG